MKIALLGDLHIGARGSNPHVRDFMKKYFEYVFADMKKRGIDLYLQLGDAFDNRKTLNAFDYAFLEDEFVPLHKKHDIQGVYLDGNHDLAYKESSSISWVKLLEHLSKGFIDRVDVVSDFDLGTHTIGILPWVNESNLKESLEFLEASKSDYLFSHLEMGGFEMYRSSVCEESRFNLNMGHFKNFKKVYSGHFHRMNESGNLKYVGTPYPLTWQDYQDAEEGQRGYHILDLDTGEEEFIPNPLEVNTFFKVFNYNWKELNLDNELQLQLKSADELSNKLGFEGKIVKVVVTDRGNQKHYEDFCAAARQCKTIDVTFIDMTGEASGGDLGEADVVLEESEELSTQTDVVSVLKERVDKGSLDESLHQPAKELIDDLYQVASTKGDL